jgi:hypothetical protein
MFLGAGRVQVRQKLLRKRFLAKLKLTAASKKTKKSTCSFLVQSLKGNCWSSSAFADAGTDSKVMLIGEAAGKEMCKDVEKVRLGGGGIV